MPIPTAIKRNTGPSGIAEVRVLKDYLRVIFVEDGDTYDGITKSGWDLESGVYNVTLERTKDAIKWIAPPGRDEPYLARFVEFGNRIGRSEVEPGVPEPKVKPGQLKQWPSGGSSWVPESLIASAKFEVVENGIYKGLTIPYELPYLFEQFPGTMITMLRGSAKQNERVEAFLRIVGGIDFALEDIPWAANVLPWLEQRIQVANRVVSLQLNDRGFIVKDGIRAVPSYVAEKLMEEKPKKAARKPKAKKVKA